MSRSSDLSATLHSSPTNCFLCKPRSELVFAATDDAIAMCGLGPLTPGYSVLATRAHLASAADASKAVPKFNVFADRVRSILETTFGSCVLTEHGRIPVCVDVSGTTDPHCYHAHFLLFPGVSNIEDRAKEYFARVESACSLADAMAIAGAHAEYFLISGTRDSFQVLSRPGKLIRQFARVLVADALGVPARANWRKYPEEQEAIRNASLLREKFRQGEMEDVT